MAEQKMTIEFDEFMAGYIKSTAYRFGYDDPKEFIEALVLQRIFRAIKEECSTNTKH